MPRVPDSESSRSSPNEVIHSQFQNLSQSTPFETPHLASGRGRALVGTILKSAQLPGGSVDDVDGIQNDIDAWHDGDRMLCELLEIKAGQPAA